MYNVKQFFKDHNIYFKSEGTNVSEGWVEINCPFPFCKDPSQHMGVNLVTSQFNCWKCGEHGQFTYLVKVLLHCGWKQANDIAGEYFKPSILTNKQTEIRQNIDFKFPYEASQKLPHLHQEYLKGRGFDPKFLQKTYNIMACYQTGDFAYRIIIPIYLFGKPVAFTARDVTNKQTLRYKNISNKNAIIPVKQCLYNIDNAEKRLLLVEGVFDVWRIGSGAIATFGTKITLTQIKMIITKKPNWVGILYDTDAIKEANKIAESLAPHITDVEVLEINYKDPAEMSRKEAIELRKELQL